MKLQKHIAAFLLAVFTLGVIPAPLFHEIFADHSDEAENHCRFYHKDLGTHIEQQQNHCDLFKTNTPLYDAVKFDHACSSPLAFASSYKHGIIIPYSFSSPFILPSRAPPVA